MGKFLFKITFRPLFLRGTLGNTYKKYVKSISTMTEGLNAIIICPEFDSLLDLTFWFKDRDIKSKKYENFLKGLEQLNEDRLNSYGELLDSYQFRLPNKLWRHSSKIEIKKEGGLYNWMLVPYLKANYNKLNLDLLKFPCLLNYNRLFQNEKEYFVYFNVIYGLFDFYQGDHIKILTYDEDFNFKEVWVRVEDPILIKKISKIEKQDIICCLTGLTYNEKWEKELILFEINPQEEKLEIIDFFQHIITERLYHDYLYSKKGLICCKKEDYDRLLKIAYLTIKNQYYKYFNQNIDIDPIKLKLLELNLSFYFQFYDNLIYYTPILIKGGGNIKDINNLLINKDNLRINTKESELIRNISLIKDLKKIKEGII